MYYFNDVHIIYYSLLYGVCHIDFSHKIISLLLQSLCASNSIKPKQPADVVDGNMKVSESATIYSLAESVKEDLPLPHPGNSPF